MGGGGAGPGQVVLAHVGVSGAGGSTWPRCPSPWAVGIWGLGLSAQLASRLYPDVPEHAGLLVPG